jgi:large subunit ribosomal protein L21
MNNAIIETGGLQFAVAEGHTIDVPLLDGNVGDKVVFDRVLFAANDEKKLVGAPTVPEARVEGEIMAQGRTEKVNVFHFKKRTTYRKKAGHRQHYTRVKITGLAL